MLYAGILARLCSARATCGRATTRWLLLNDLPCAQSIYMWPFAKSVLFGALAGAAPMLIFTTVLAIGSLPEGVNGDGNLLPSLKLAILPLVVSLPLVLGASIVIGLPLTAILKRKGWESGMVYIATGAVAGFILPIVILLLLHAPAGYWTAHLGAVGGAVTGRTWWTSAREPFAPAVE